ncbi:Hypothetical predicted protein [Mytilus galloprovincialis]|uniref:Uncharacterized protein n=1 Tax=Mytilus galloprovincialis TaxID=29158 RepID=A0A8B6EIL4_MYTGA|nr:Hypothetical predicted protein [Mytilus galloprovincialis]
MSETTSARYVKAYFCLDMSTPTSASIFQSLLLPRYVKSYFCLDIQSLLLPRYVKSYSASICQILLLPRYVKSYFYLDMSKPTFASICQSLHSICNARAYICSVMSNTTSATLLQRLCLFLIAKTSFAPAATPHATLEDTYIDGKLVPKQTVILCHLMSVLYDPTQWQEPEKFLPERFLGEKGELIKHEAFCPFSMGPRTCIGQQLASNEVFLFFTSFLQRFNFTTVNKDDCVSTDGEQTGVTRQPYPFEMCFKPI